MIGWLSSLTWTVSTTYLNKEIESFDLKMLLLLEIFLSLGFYCQVEELLNPALKGKPIAVVQYNAWRGGG